MKRTYLGMGGVAVALVLYVGCNSEPAAQPVKVGPAPAEEMHEHAQEGPHKGQLIELGMEEYHAEIVHDDASGNVTIYILDGAAKLNVPIDAKEVVINLTVDGKPQQHTLAALPMEGEPEGKSSRFELVSKELCEGLDSEKSEPRLNVTIADKPFIGKIEAHHHH